jgi:two-component system, OmpR family, phosphate regulon sensor histidine kinase PhoR
MEPHTFNTLLAASAATLAASTAVAGVLVLRLRRSHRQALAALEAVAAVDSAVSTRTEPTIPALPESNPWRNLAQSVAHALITSRARADLAESQRTSLEVRAQRSAAQCDRLMAVLQTLGEPVLVVDDYDELVLANNSAERLFNFSIHEVAERALARVVRCERLLELVRETRMRKAVAPRTEEVELPGPDGRGRWYSVWAQSLASATAQAQSGADRGAVAVLRDITAEKAAQRRHAEFVSAVSHEMKTPLTGIKAYVELLADGDAEDEATREEFLSVIEVQAERLQRLIDNLLNLSRIEAGVVQVQKRVLSLNEVLTEALNVVRPAAEAKQIALQSELSPLFLPVLVDRDQMLQAAINLLSNAVKYTPEGGRVVVRSRLNGDDAEFSVEDTGVGLTPEDQVRIFERFYRVAKDKQMAPGTGLGLPLARSIVEEVHGGRVSVASQPGVGSTFTVTLPCAAQLT